jgi:hypothetical protein
MTKDPGTFGIEDVDASLDAQVRELPRVYGSQKCSCDGGGWIVTLDRDRYSSPGDAGMLHYTRCFCFFPPGSAREG